VIDTPGVYCRICGLTEILNCKSVYRTALIGVENAEGPKDTAGLYVECLVSRNEPSRRYV
jgi:hypothetical protein